jgi:hypothetical protein
MAFSIVGSPVFLLFEELAPFVCNFSEVGPERLIHIFVSCVGQAGASVGATCYKYKAFRLVLEIGFVFVSCVGQAGASVGATCYKYKLLIATQIVTHMCVFVFIFKYCVV